MDYQNYIDGRWLASSDGKTFEQRNPANLEEVTGHWPKSTREDAKQAIESSHAAFVDWAGIGVHKRAEYLSKVQFWKERAERLPEKGVQKTAGGVSDCAGRGDVWRDGAFLDAGGLCL